MCDQQILAIGFLLVILSAALFKNYLTLLVVATYVIAPLPNWLCGRAANADDFMESHGNGVVDFGRFLTGFFVVMGIGKSSLPRARGGCAGQHEFAPGQDRNEHSIHLLKRNIADQKQHSRHSSGTRRKSQEAQQPCPYSAVF